MTITFTESVDTLSPFVGQKAPVLFGIEHEYNCDYDPSDYCDCGDPDCEAYPSSSLLPLALPPGWDQHCEHCGWEVKSPPMDDIGEAMDVFRRIRQTLNEGHDDCGYHIHLNADADRGPAVDVVKFGTNWLAHRPTLWSHCPSYDNEVGLSGGRSSYAEQMPGTVEDWMDLPERYLEVNWTALGAHCTIEVRLASATSNLEHFELWLRYVLAIADMSLLTEDPVDAYANHVTFREDTWGGTQYNAAARHLFALGHGAVEVQALAVRRVA